MKPLNRQYSNKLSLIKSAILNLIFPNQCLICEEIINEESIFCSNHHKKVKFIESCKCQICSRPLDSKSFFKDKCIKCLEKLPSYDSSTILFTYEKFISKLILSFKYNDNTYICKKLGKLFAQKIEKEPEILIAVPLHKKRLKSRKYNQSIVLGKHICANLNNTRFIPDLLIRTKFSKTQENLNKSQRMSNLKDAFEINDKYRDLVKDKNIMIVDDVVTTGATLENCCKILKLNGVSEVQIAAIAKTDYVER